MADGDKNPWEGDTNVHGEEELRISEDDGMAYAKLEFIAYFGGTAEWDKAAVAHVVLDYDASEEEELAAKAAALSIEGERQSKELETSSNDAVANTATKEEEKKAHAEEVRRVSEVIAKKQQEKEEREKKEAEERAKVEKEEAEKKKKEREEREALETIELAEELAEANRMQKKLEEDQRAENLAKMAEKRRLNLVEDAAIAKAKADEKLKKEQNRAKRKKEAASKAARSAERAAQKAAAAKLSAKKAMLKEREAKIHAGLEVEKEEIFLARIAAQEAVDLEEQQSGPEVDTVDPNDRSTATEANEANEANKAEIGNITPNSKSVVPVFLSPRDPTHLRPDLPRYGVEHEIMNQEVSEFEIEAGLTLRDIARQMEAARDIEVEAANLQLQYQIRSCHPHYNHDKFEESYQDLIKQQMEFKKSLVWDKDPEKRHMPVSPRITSFYNPRISDSRRVPQKPTSFSGGGGGGGGGGGEKGENSGGGRRVTPNSAHRKLKKGAVYARTRAKKKKNLSAKAMLESFVKNRASIPPRPITALHPVRDSNVQLKIVLETRSVSKKFTHSVSTPFQHHQKSVIDKCTRKQSNFDVN